MEILQYLCLADERRTTLHGIGWWNDAYRHRVVGIQCINECREGGLNCGLSSRPWCRTWVDGRSLPRLTVFEHFVNDKQIKSWNDFRALVVLLIQLWYKVGGKYGSKVLEYKIKWEKILQRKINDRHPPPPLYYDAPVQWLPHDQVKQIHGAQDHNGRQQPQGDISSHTN